MRQELKEDEPIPLRLSTLAELAAARLQVSATTHWRSDERTIVLTPVKSYDFLLTPISGELDATIAGRHFRILPGQAMLVAAGMPHRGQRVRGGAAMVACTLHLDLRDAANAPLLARWRQPLLRCPPGWAEALARVHAVPDQALRHRLAAHHLRSLLLAQERPEDLLAPAAHGGRLAGLLTMMDERCAEELDAATMAAAAGLSPAHLRAVFRRQLGCTPHRHLVRLRLRRAGDLLRSGARVAEVAAATGFASVRGLRLAFRRELGCAPSAWRRDD